jgi:hypothetical protein
MDKEKRVVGVLAGQPKSRDWANACNNAFAALDQLAERIKPSPKDVQSRRGIFPTIAYGISLGNGQTVCATLILFPLYVVLRH